MAIGINKIYSDNFKDSKITAKERINHDTLISTNVADQFNTYRTWSSFNMSVDVDPLTINDMKKDSDGNYVRKNTSDYSADQTIKSTGVRSIFNKFHSVPLEAKSYGWRVSQNMPLLDSPQSRKLQRSLNACTVRDLVQKSQIGLLGTSVYDWSDFMYCKYLGRVSNNYLITLRRYTVPVNDYIKPYGNPTAINGGDNVTTKTDNGGVQLGCMVTWLGTPGNEMSEIMKYNFSMPFKSQNSRFESDGKEAAEARDMSSKGMISQGFKKAFANDYTKRLGNIIMPGIYNMRENRSLPPGPAPYYCDPNKAYNGIDMIKSIWVRDTEKGLQFQNSFKLTFDYELRSYDGVNGKQAMLDLLGNILTVCYTTGDFWPGTYRSEAHANSMEPMSSLECMKHHDTFSGYVGAFEKDFVRIKSAISSFFKNPIEAVKTLLNNIGGIFMGGNLEAASPVRQNAVNSLLSDTAYGLWHITVGNPCAPILSMGNMILTNTEVEHYGPLGLDDFPTGLRVTCTFEHGKPRDKRLIERMYIGGNDRIYMPLDENVINILKNAKTRTQNSMDGNRGQSRKELTTKHSISSGVKAGVATDAEINARNAEQEQAMENAVSKTQSTNDIDDTKRVDVISNLSSAEIMKRIFGSMPGSGMTQSILWTAGEVNRGVRGKDKSSTSNKMEGANDTKTK